MHGAWGRHRNPYTNYMMRQKGHPFVWWSTARTERWDSAYKGKVIIPPKKIRMFPCLTSFSARMFGEIRLPSGAYTPVSAAERGCFNSNPQVAFQVSHYEKNLDLKTSTYLVNVWWKFNSLYMQSKCLVVTVKVFGSCKEQWKTCVGNLTE